MPWPQSSARRYRMAVSYLIDSGKPAAVKLDPELAELWATVQSDGYDLLCCDAQGVTLAHQRTAWTYASRTGAITITAPTPPSGATVGVVYLYWGPSATVAADPSTTVSGTTTPGYALPPATLPAAEVDVPPVASGNGYTSGIVVLIPVSSGRLVALPLPVSRADTPGQGGAELEDVAGLAVVVADGNGDSEPTTPANWWSDSNVRCAWAPSRGTVALVLVTPDEAQPATLRVRAYLKGPASGSLPSRTLAVYATVRGITPQE
jgi:hypothetical protein